MTLSHRCSVLVGEFTNWARKHVVSQRVIESFTKAKASAAVDHSKVRSLQQAARDNRASVMATGQAMARAARARKLAVRKIARKTNFGVREMRMIKKEFVKEAGRDGQLSRDQFCRILTSMFPALSRKEANDLFTGFDTDGGGELDFKEFSVGMLKTIRVPTLEKVSGELGRVAGVSVMACEVFHLTLWPWVTVQIKLLFVSLDENGDGDVTIEEVLEFVNSGNEEVRRTAVLRCPSTQWHRYRRMLSVWMLRGPGVERMRVCRGGDQTHGRGWRRHCGPR